MLIIDENGKASKRDVESNNMHELLKAENNLERVSKIINDLEKSLNQASLFSSYSRKEKIVTCLLPFIPAVMAVGAGTLFGGLTFLQVLSGFPIAIIVSYVGFSIPFVYGEKARVRFNNGLRSELESAYQLKDSYEKKLSSVKSKTEGKDENITNTKDIISLEESMILPSEDSEQLTEAFINGYGPKVKKLVLRK